MIIEENGPMLSERKKKTLILIYLGAAIILNSMVLLFDLFNEGYFAKFLFNTGLTRWGWLPSIVFSDASLVLTLVWKPGTRIMRVIIILVSLLMLIYALLWLAGIYFISHLHF